jgi:hypothetical protein
MKLKPNKVVKTLFDTWRFNQINPPTNGEVEEAKAIYKTLTDPAFKGSNAAFCINAWMQAGKTNIMLGLGCLWLDRDATSKVHLTTSYTSKSHTSGLLNAVSSLYQMDSRFYQLFKFYKPDKMKTMVNDHLIRPNDLVLFDEDQSGTTYDSETRYKKLVANVKSIGCAFGSVGATNIAWLDAARSSGNFVFHQIKPNEFYRGVEHLVDNINNNRTSFVDIREGVEHIMHSLCKHSLNTEDERFGVYLCRVKPRADMEIAMSICNDYGMPVVMCMGDTTAKVETNKEAYTTGLELIGIDVEDSESTTLTNIIAKTFEWSKLNAKDVVLFIDGALGCGVNLDKLVNKELFPHTTYGDLTDVYHSNKPFIKGGIESLKVLVSMLQGGPGRGCRYVDIGGKHSDILDELFEQQFWSFNMDAMVLGIDILKNPIEFANNPEPYFSRANELEVSLYTDYKDDEVCDESFSEAHLILEGDYSTDIQSILKQFGESDITINTINDGWSLVKKNLIYGGSARIAETHPSSKHISFSTSEYNTKKVGGSHLKFNFQNQKLHSDKPNYGLGIDKKSKQIRLYKKGEWVSNYSVIESRRNTAHSELFA